MNVIIKAGDKKRQILTFGVFGIYCKLDRAGQDAHIFFKLFYVDYYLDNQVLERLEKYCEDTGLTKTVAIERILGKFFDQNEKNNQSDK